MTATTEPEQRQRLPLLAGLVAVVSSLFGLVLVVNMVMGADPVVAANTEARQGDLSAWVDRYEWLEHDHGAHEHDDEEEVSEEQQQIDDITAQAEVFPMPANMMPGTPNDGFQRLQVNLSFANRGVGEAEVLPEQFLLESSTGDSWLSLRGGTFSAVDLGPQHLLSTVLAFDVPEELSSSDMYLVWSWNGESTRFALNGSGHAHG